MIRPPAQIDQRPAYVYLLRSQLDGTLYLGWTTDVGHRLAEHNTSGKGFTRRKRPWSLVGWERATSIEEAKRRERALKRNRRMRTLFQQRMLDRAAGKYEQVVG